MYTVHLRKKTNGTCKSKSNAATNKNKKNCTQKEYLRGVDLAGDAMCKHLVHLPMSAQWEEAGIYGDVKP